MTSKTAKVVEAVKQASRSGSRRTEKTEPIPLDQVNPGVLATAMRYAGGQRSRITAVSPTNVYVNTR